MNYFKECKTKDEAKTLFRTLAKQFHPDHGGSAESMRNLTDQFESFEETKQQSQWNNTNWSDQFEWSQEWKRTQQQRQEKIDIRELQKQRKIDEENINYMNRKIRDLQTTIENLRVNLTSQRLEIECLNDLLKRNQLDLDKINEFGNASFFGKIKLFLKDIWK